MRTFIEGVAGVVQLGGCLASMQSGSGFVLEWLPSTALIAVALLPVANQIARQFTCEDPGQDSEESDRDS